MKEELTKEELKIVKKSLPEGKKAIREYMKRAERRHKVEEEYDKWRTRLVKRMEEADKAKKEEKTYWAQEFVWGTRCPRCDHVSTRLATRKELDHGPGDGERIGTTCQCGLYYEEDIQVINPQPRRRT